ncbi:hypothetical protein PAAL109150_09815 [Paenibacillus alkaliterrae]
MMGYGNDTGLRITYTILTHNVLSWKARTMVNYDADEGINIDELYKCVNESSRKVISNTG